MDRFSLDQNKVDHGWVSTIGYILKEVFPSQGAQKILGRNLLVPRERGVRHNEIIKIHK